MQIIAGGFTAKVIDHAIHPEFPIELADERLITRRQLQQILPVSTTTIWRLEKSGRFPKHVTIGGLNFWRAIEVREYLSRAT